MAERIARVRLADGRIARFAVDETLSPQDILTHAENYFGGGATVVPTTGPESTYESMRKAGAEMGAGKAFIAGAGIRLNDYAMRLKQLLGQTLTPQEQADIAAGQQASGPAAFGRVAADIGAGLPFTPASLPGAVAAGGAQGFLSNPVLPGETGAQHALSGAIGGGIGYGGAKLMQGLARPVTPTADVQALVKEGVIPTVGQSAQASGSRTGQMIGRAEEAATSIPGAGQVISGARQRAVEDLQRAAFARATPRGIRPTEHIGREGLDDTYDAISGRYNDALTRIGLVRDPNNSLGPDIQRRVNQAVVGLPKDRANEARQIIQDLIGNRQSPVQGAYTAEIAKQVDSDLGARVRDFQNARNDPSARQMAEALRAAQGAWRDLIRRNAPDQATRNMLDDANRAFANYVRVERASTAPGNIAGEFGPTQLDRAVRATSPGARKSQYARGDALMQDLSDPARSVLTGTLGESGTVPRALLAGAVLGGGAAANSQYGDYPGSGALTGILAAGALAPLLYSRGASRYAIGDLVPSVQNTLADILGVSAPYSGLVGRSLYPELQR